MAQIEQKILTEMKNKIKQFIVNNFLFGNESEAPKDDDSFLETGILDSTGMLELITFIEGNFTIKVEDDELVPENLDTLNKIVTFINRKKSIENSS